jgi:DNA mismatch endonuclease (patch repair protein)
MRKLLQKAGLSFKMYPKLFGNPDFLVERRVVVFCDSSFWHGRNWPKLRKQLRAGSNWRYWVSHIARNRARDRRVTNELRKAGYLVLRFWDQDVFKRPDRCLSQVIRAVSAVDW